MQRTILKQLINWHKSKGRKPLIIHGARQIGKTHILKKFGEKYFTQCHYFNFEDSPELRQIFEFSLKPQKLLESLETVSKKSIDIKKDLIIFDEIQSCPKAITSLKYFYEDLAELALCSAGSLLGLELSPVSYPVGKVDLIEMFPMSFYEFIEACGETKLLHALINNKKTEEPFHGILWGKLKHYFITGGLPEIVQYYIDSKHNPVELFTEIRKKQKNLSKFYIADMAKHAGKVNSMHLERLWVNIPAQLAQSLDGSANKFKLKGQINNINGFEQIASALDWLNKARIIIKVPIANCGLEPSMAYTKENTFKLFMFDIGILGALANLDPINILNYDYGTYKGFFAENFVAQEAAYAQGSRDHIYSWRENTAELEFLLKREGKIIPVEVKAGTVTQSKSAKVFMQKYQSPYRINISAKKLNIDKKTNVYNYPLYLSYEVFNDD